MLLLLLLVYFCKKQTKVPQLTVLLLAFKGTYKGSWALFKIKPRCINLTHIQAHNSFFHAPEPLDLLKVEDKNRKQDRQRFCFPAAVVVVLTANSEFPTTTIYTFVYVNHHILSFSRCLPHRTVIAEVVHSPGKMLNRMQDGFNSSQDDFSS